MRLKTYVWSYTGFAIHDDNQSVSSWNISTIQTVKAQAKVSSLRNTWDNVKKKFRIEIHYNYYICKIIWIYCSFWHHISIYLLFFRCQILGWSRSQTVTSGYSSTRRKRQRSTSKKIRQKNGGTYPSRRFNCVRHWTFWNMVWNVYCWLRSCDYSTSIEHPAIFKNAWS